MTIHKSSLRKLRRSIPGLLFLFISMTGMAQAEFTSECVDSADVFVNDETFTFFSPITRRQFEDIVDRIDSLAMSKVEVGLKPKSGPEICTGNDFKGQFSGILNSKDECVRDKDVSTATPPVNKKDAKGLVIRTVWKGGQRDLRFIDRPATPEEARSNIGLTLRYLTGGTPQMIVEGDTCRFESSDDITMNPSFPEKSEGSNQNYKHFASFVAHQLVKLTEVEGCNLGSEAKNIIVQLTAAGRKQALPGGFELRSREARATEDERYERAIYPGDNYELAKDSSAEVGIFNRPTELIYRIENPFYDEAWEEIHKEEIDSNFICGVFDLGDEEKVSLNPQVMDVPSDALDEARLHFQLATGSSYFQRNPKLTFKARWLSLGQNAAVVSESKWVSVVDNEGIAEFELAGSSPYPSRVLPGRYRIELEWKTEPASPISKTISFFWNSREGHNVSDYFGVLGPLRVDLKFERGVRVSNLIMKGYFFQQRLTKEMIKWEKWPKPNDRRFAGGLLWHFRETGTLPYLSKWEGRPGVAAELVRALSVVTADEDWIGTEDTETALEYLSKIDLIPANFSKSITLRQAMCKLSSRLEELGEPIPALWMDCR